MPPHEHPQGAFYIVFFVCRAYFPQYFLTADASSRTPPRRIRHCIFRMLSILCPILSNSRCLLKNTTKTHSTLFFSYVERNFCHTLEQQMPPHEHPQGAFYIVFFVCRAYFPNTFKRYLISRSTSSWLLPQTSKIPDDGWSAGQKSIKIDTFPSLPR